MIANVLTADSLWSFSNPTIFSKHRRHISDMLEKRRVGVTDQLTVVVST